MISNNAIQVVLGDTFFKLANIWVTNLKKYMRKNKYGLKFRKEMILKWNLDIYMSIILLDA